MGRRFLSLLGFLLLAACSSPKEHAPFQGGGTDHFSGPGLVGGKGSGGGGASGFGDAGTGTGTLSGTISVYTDLTFSAVQAFTGSGTITVRGIHDVTGTFSGGVFQLDSVDPTRALWVGLQATSQAADILPTISPADGAATSVALAFGRRSALADILSTAVTTPQALESDRAQILVGFVTSAASPLPVPGVQITQSPGKTVLYDAGNTYSDSFGATQGRGIAVIANATASAKFPGDRVVVTYRIPKTKTLGTFEVLASQGALTIALVAIQ